MNHPNNHTLTDLNALTLPDLYAHLTRTGLAERLFALARDEDTEPIDHAGASGDITSLATVTENATATVNLTLRQDATVAGLACIPDLLRAFQAADTVTVTHHADDAQNLPAGTALATLNAPTRTLLTLERTLLNTISRLTGVATLTKRFADALAGTHAELLDTRKTTPGLRALEKYAVRCGGAKLHRFNLTDAALIKDNHIAATPPAQLADTLARAARLARGDRPLRFVEVEVDTLEQLDAVLSLPPGTADIALLDNMTTDQLREAARRRDEHNPRLLLEASGGITLHNIAAAARTGIDRVAVGAITHQAAAIDIALDAAPAD